LLLGLLSVKETGPSDFLLLPVAAGFLLFVVRAPGGFVDRGLTCKPVSWLGKVSYSIYMVHYPILWAYLQTVRVVLKAPAVTIGTDRVPVPSESMGWLFLIGALGTVLVVSHLSFHWIEEPLRKKSKVLAARWFPEGAKPRPAVAPPIGGGVLAEAFRVVGLRRATGWLAG
jgi:peptidoglycan/LPS O-acetylase OafA/YrhL